MAEANRKLAAILNADVVREPRLVRAGEAATVETIKRYRVVIGHASERRIGRIVPFNYFPTRRSLSGGGSIVGSGPCLQ